MEVPWLRNDSVASVNLADIGGVTKGSVSESDKHNQADLMLFMLDATHSNLTRFSALRAGRRGRTDIFASGFGADGLRSEMECRL